MKTQTPSFQHDFCRKLDRQTGGLLIFGMVLLVVLTVIGLAAGTTSSLQLKMSSNALQKNSSFQFAEDALAVAEKQAIALADDIRWNAIPFDCSTTGYYAPIPTVETDRVNCTTGLPALDPKTFDWNNAVVVNGTNARYVIEYLGAYDNIAMRTDAARGQAGQKQKRAYIFRLTARGATADESFTYLQEMYMRV